MLCLRQCNTIFVTNAFVIQCIGSADGTFKRQSRERIQDVLVTWSHYETQHYGDA